MKRRTPILLLAAFSLIVFPWRSLDLCLAHPAGHDHHEGHGTCKLRRIIHADTYWPPMECERLDADAGEFQSNERVALRNPARTMLVAVLLTGKLQLPEFVRHWARPPDPPGTSDPPLRVPPLRGPPIV